LALHGERPVTNSQENTVFISYAREDSDAAKRLQKDLKNAGLNPWLDRECLIAGKNWKISIRKAIKESRYFIPLFSSVSVIKRGYVQKEFKYAIEVLDEFPELEIFVIPCRLDDCEIPYEKLEDIEYVDLFPMWEDGIRRIIQSVTSETDNHGLGTVKHKVKPQPMVQTTSPSINFGRIIVRNTKEWCI
jgi:TIR domain-containing protein